MTPEAVLIMLLERLGTARDSATLISAMELNDWPSDAVAALKGQKLIVKARIASSAICPGCEEGCVMPVQAPPDGARKAEPFIVCDKRDDVNRVPVPADRLEQWRCGMKEVCQFVADRLELHQAIKHLEKSNLWEIGIVPGKKRRQMIGLRVANLLKLTAGTSDAPLVDLVGYHEGAFTLDTKEIRRLVDSSTAADPRHTTITDRREERKRGTQTRHEKWREAYLKLKKDHPDKSDTWCAIQISKMTIGKGFEVETIRKNMKPRK
jgi:hypothetical protein